MAARCEREAIAAALLLCAADATVIGAGRSPCAAGATATATATGPVLRRWARLQSAQLRRGPTTAAAAATTLTATGFARTTERREQRVGRVSDSVLRRPNRRQDGGL